MSALRFDDSLQPLQPGQRVREAVNVTRMNALATLAQEGAMGTHMRTGPGLLLTRGPQGTILKLRKQVQRGMGVKPLDCYIADRSGDSLKLQVRPGTIVSVMPTIGGTRLDAGTPPYLVLPTTGTKYVVFNVTTTFTNVDGVFILPAFSGTTVPITLEDSDPGAAGMKAADGHFHFLLATYVDGVKTLQNGWGPITGELCDTLQGTGDGGPKAQLNLQYPST